VALASAHDLLLNLSLQSLNRATLTRSFFTGMPKGPQKLPAARRIEIAAFPDMIALDLMESLYVEALKK
jgi:hypothetical protein